jgi:hypothetical protein
MSLVVGLLAFAGCHANNGNNGMDMGVGGGDDLSTGGGGTGGGGGGGGVGGTGLTGSGTPCSSNSMCPGGQVCLSLGQCACPPYQAYCNGMCIPVANDGQNCGACGVMCTGTSACYGGKCNAAGCPAGLMNCSNACVDTTTDNNHCGGCTGPTAKCDPTNPTTPTGCVGGHCVPIAGSTTGAPGMCTNGGPPINVGGGGPATCAGVIASNTFTFALCSCSNINSSGSIRTDGFDSLQGPYPSPPPPWPAGLGAGVGANGSVTDQSTLDVGGPMVCSGNASGPVDVKQDLYVGGNCSGPTCGGNAFINTGTVNFSGPGPHMTKTGVTVPPPCVYCPTTANPKPIDVAGFVMAHVSSNDNAAIGLSDTLFGAGTGPSRLDLPCGSYYLKGVSRAGATIVAHGHVALYVDAPGITGENLIFTLDPTATLDIFVNGPVTSQAIIVGSINYPALTRLYIAGSWSVSSSATMYANVYDVSSVTFSSGATIYGALYASSAGSDADLTIHYDREVVQQGLTCPPAPNPDGGGGGGCSTCKDCNNQACVGGTPSGGGTCGACTTSADCCAPLTCTNGQCVLPIQ